MRRGKLIHFVPELHSELPQPVPGESSSFRTAENSFHEEEAPIGPARMEVPYSPAQWLKSLIPTTPQVSSEAVLGRIRGSGSSSHDDAPAQFLSDMTPHFYTAAPPTSADAMQPALELREKTVSERRAPFQGAPLVSLAKARGGGGEETVDDFAEVESVFAEIAVPVLPELQLSSRTNATDGRDGNSMIGNVRHELPPTMTMEGISETSDENTHELEARAPTAAVAAAEHAAATEDADLASMSSTEERPRASEAEEERQLQSGNRRGWGFLGGVEEKAKQQQQQTQSAELMSIKRSACDQLRKERGEETDADKERAQKRKEARAKREAELSQRRFLQKGKVWKLNSNQPGEKKEQWRLRLLMLDGGGGLSYVSEKDAGETTRVCNVNAMLRCEVVQQPHSLCFPHVFKVGYKAEAKAKEKEAKDGQEKEETGAGIARAVSASDSPQNAQRGRKPEKAAKAEKTIIFAAESEAEQQQWVKKLRVYLVQTELPSHLVMAQAMFQRSRTMVSGQRRRYVDGKFDLDLTYITSRIIAMAFPAEDSIGQFSIAIRNDLRVVKQFLDEKHARKYKVFNLCAEKQYLSSKFDNNVEWLPFLDHNPPTLSQIKTFCYRVEKWLLLDPDNVVAVHCKGGKGRTGLMIACYLLSNGHADETPIRTAKEAVDYFAHRRTNGGLNQGQKPQTVSGVSQLRCVQYFAEGHQHGLQYRRIRITKVEFTRVPDSGRSYFEPVVRVSSGAHELYRSQHHQVRFGCCGGRGGPQRHRFQAGSDGPMEVECRDRLVVVAEDFKVELFDGNPSDEGQKLADQAVCFACLHASKAAASPLVLGQGEVDQAARDVGRHKVFPAGFELRVHFETLEPTEPEQERPLTFNEDQQLWFAHKIVDECEPDVFESGETVMRLGTDDDKMYLIGKGSVRLERGERVLQAAVGPLEILAEQQFLLDNAGLAGDVVANLDPTILYPIDRFTASAYFEDLGALYHVLCIKMVSKWVASARNAGQAARGASGEEAAAEGAGQPKQQRLLRSLELPATERILAQCPCHAASPDSSGRARGQLLLTQSYLVFVPDSGPVGRSPPRTLNLAKILSQQRLAEADARVSYLVPLSKDKDTSSEASFTFHFASAADADTFTASLQRLLADRTSFSLSWIPEPSNTTWPFRVDEALSPLFLLSLSSAAALGAKGAAANRRGSFLNPRGSFLRTRSFASRAPGEQVHLGARQSIDKIRNWGADTTLYIVLKGALVVSHKQSILARYGPGEVFGWVQFVDPSQKRALEITAGATGADLKAIPAEHLRQTLAREDEFRAMFWEFGAKVLALRLRRGTVF